MPVVDMSLDKLYEYQGRTPCPEDFDKYWDDALKEMNSLDPKAEFIKKEYPSKICDMYDFSHWFRLSLLFLYILPHGRENVHMF